MSIKMSELQNSSRFCLFCYKITNQPDETSRNSDSIKIFTKIINRLTKLEKKDQSLIKSLLLQNICDVNELLRYCTNCKEIVEDFFETFHLFKSLELKLNWKLDKLKEKISYANKVPSRWVNVRTALEKFHMNDPSKTLTSQSTIREFRQTIVKAADYRMLKYQPHVSLKRKEYVDEVTKLIKSDHWTGAKPNYMRNMCQKCGKQFKNLQGLHQHISYHRSKNKPRAGCPQCGKKFSKNHNLKVHMKTHLGEKPLKCRFCACVFAYKKTIIRHLKEKHKNEKELQTELSRKWESNSKVVVERECNAMEEYNMDYYNDQHEDYISPEDSSIDDLSTNANFENASIEIICNSDILIHPLVKIEPFPCPEADEGSFENIPTQATVSGSIKNGLKNNSFMNNIYCEFCKKSFPGIDQLCRHINEDLCGENKAENQIRSRDKIVENSDIKHEPSILSPNIYESEMDTEF